MTKGSSVTERRLSERRSLTSTRRLPRMRSLLLRGWEPMLGRSCEPSMGPASMARPRYLRGALPLLWLIVPVAEMAGKDPSPLELVLALLGVLAFCACYVLGMFETLLRRRIKPLAGLLALVVLGVLLTLLGAPTFSILFIFTGVWAAMRLGRWALVGVLVCTVLTGGLSAAAGENVYYVISMTAVTLSIGAMMLAFGRLIYANVELEGARHELARLAVSDERVRFARDLHDLLGHSLSVIALKAELTGRLLQTDPAAAAVHVSELERVARDALSDVREAVSGYYQPVLASELDGARFALEAAGIEAELQRPEVDLPAEVEALLAWTVREGTTNVIRHSGARRCRVEISPGLSSASAEISDDGRGPGVDCAERAARAIAGRAARDGEAIQSHGLAGLRERVERLAGRLEAGLGPEGGFCLRVVVPLAVPAAAREAPGRR